MTNLQLSLASTASSSNTFHITQQKMKKSIVEEAEEGVSKQFVPTSWMQVMCFFHHKYFCMEGPKAERP